MFPYDPAARVRRRARAARRRAVDVGDQRWTHDAHASVRARAVRAVRRTPPPSRCYWLDQYGGGIYLAFRDGTSGAASYGGGRYLLDTVKGADLGVEGDRLVLDFNFAYQPSCSYDPRWSCPLPPPENRLDVRGRGRGTFERARRLSGG